MVWLLEFIITFGNVKVIRDTFNWSFPDFNEKLIKKVKQYAKHPVNKNILNLNAKCKITCIADHIIEIMFCFSM